MITQSFSFSPYINSRREQEDGQQSRRWWQPYLTPSPMHAHLTTSGARIVVGYNIYCTDRAHRRHSYEHSTPVKVSFKTIWSCDTNMAGWDNHSPSSIVRLIIAGPDVNNGIDIPINQSEFACCENLQDVRTALKQFQLKYSPIFEEAVRTLYPEQQKVRFVIGGQMVNVEDVFKESLMMAVSHEVVNNGYLNTATTFTKRPDFSRFHLTKQRESGTVCLRLCGENAPADSQCAKRRRGRGRIDQFVQVRHEPHQTQAGR